MTINLIHLNHQVDYLKFDLKIRNEIIKFIIFSPKNKLRKNYIIYSGVFSFFFLGFFGALGFSEFSS